MNKMRAAVVLILSLGALACASAGSTGSRKIDMNRITQEEIQAATTAITLYDLVNQLRPQWFQARGGRTLNLASGGILVYHGQSRLGGIEVLREWSPDMVTGLRFLDSARAQAMLPGVSGMHIEGAIVIETGHRQR